MRKMVALAGFLMLGLSPSFVDWQQSNPREREKIVGYYAIALILVYVGLLKG